MLRIALALTRVRSLACRIWSCSAEDSSCRRPEKRSSMPRRDSSSTSRRMVSENKLISASTSSRGRDQFSVEKAYSVRTRTPRRSADSATRRMVSIPALCPMTRGSKRSRAHRLLPSMMIATCSGGGNWLTGCSWALDLHDLGFLAGGHLVDQTDVPVSDLLQLVTPAPGLVGRDLVHQRRAGAAGANGEDLLGEGVQALLHLGLSVPDVGLDHSGGPTSVPIGLPATTPSRLPPCDRSKTMIGILFSRQRVTAV